MVHIKLVYGSIRVNGAAPRMDPQITYLRPYLSPNNPPPKVPIADAARKANRQSCELCTEMPNLFIKKNVK